MASPLAIVDVGYGRGVVAARSIEPGEVLARFVGRVAPLDDIPEPELNYVVRVARDSYLIPEAPARWFNHSCAPNCTISDRLEIVARRPVREGQQLTIAYNQVTAEEAGAWGAFWHPRWTFACRCGEKECVGMVDRYVVVPSPGACDRNGLSFEATRPVDGAAIAAIAREIGTFTPEEVECLEHDVATEAEAVVEGRSWDRLTTARSGDGIVGFAHTGPLAMTADSWMLYWILVSPRFHGRGIGRDLIRLAEEEALARGARMLFIETSDQPEFAAARRLYERCGFRLAATLADYYDRGNAKCVFSRALGPDAGDR